LGFEVGTVGEPQSADVVVVSAEHVRRARQQLEFFRAERCGAIRAGQRLERFAPRALGVGRASSFRLGDRTHRADYRVQAIDSLPTTVRVEGGRTLLSDGPSVEAKEHLGGDLVVEADELDAALELAARVPAARLGGAIEEQLTAFARQRDLLMTIPGVKQRSAEVLIAEIGVDMSAFPTPKHLASGAGVCPATTAPPANAAPAGPARAPSGCARR
jgi:transposase